MSTRQEPKHSITGRQVKMYLVSGTVQGTIVGEYDTSVESVLLYEIQDAAGTLHYMTRQFFSLEKEKAAKG